jgi:hypothetical protein
LGSTSKTRNVVRKLTWWWWIALVLTAATLLAIAVSFRWVIAWSDASYRHYVYLEHGMLCAHNVNRPPTTGARRLPWYGCIEAFRSSIYERWDLLPRYSTLGPGQWSVKFPLHVILLVSIPMAVYPLLPPVVRRKRRAAGLCPWCGYDLTKNVTGRCPECGACGMMFAVASRSAM